MPADDSVDQLERELETVERSMSAVGGLSAQQAQRVAERVDRLASQLLAITTPEPWDGVHARLGTTPASGEDFSALVGELGSPDGEG
jgi:predicted metal-dependent phosphoesterase TrpH